MALGYFNHDSLFDLAVVTLSGSVEVFSFNDWNPPGGSRWTFQPVRNLTTPMAQDARGIVAADVNSTILQRKP